VQSELDDLLMVYSDLEEKAKQYKVGSVAKTRASFLAAFCANMYFDRTDLDPSARMSQTRMTMTNTKTRTRIVIRMTNPRLEDMRARLKVRRDKRTQRFGAT
jgi:hypothetical protein